MSDRVAATQRLQKIVSESIEQIISTLANIVRSDDQQLVARSIVLSFIDRKCPDLLKACFKLRVDSAETVEELIAQDTLAKYIIQDIILFTSRSWVKETLGPSLKKYISMKKNMCPDPRTNAMSEETRAKLGEIIKDCVSDLVKSIDTMPSELKRILVFAKKKLERKWPATGDSSPTSNMIVFLFAHVVIPATAQPQVWGITKEPHTSESGRTSLVLNKLFRNIASGSSFDASSPLASYNTSIKKLQAKLKDFGEALISADKTSEVAPPPLKPSEPQTSEVVNSAFQCLHHCMYLWKDAILDYRNSLSNVPVAEARIFFDIMGILEELELIEGKPECITDFTTLSFDKSMKPPTKATMRRSAASVSSATASSSGSGSPAKPYVRQLSEKWNREHAQMLVEAKKREQSAEQRKANRDEYIRGKAAAAANGGTPKSSPTPSQKVPRKTSFGEEGTRSPLKRSLTSEMPDGSSSNGSLADIGTVEAVEPSQPATTVTAVTTKPGIDSIAEESDASSPVPTSTPLATVTATVSTTTEASIPHTDLEDDAILGANPPVITVPSQDALKDTTSSLTDTTLTADTTTPPTTTRTLSASGLLGSDTEGTSTSPVNSTPSTPTKSKHRKSKRMTTTAAILASGASDSEGPVATKAYAESDLDIVSPGQKRRKKPETRSPSTGPVLEPKPKKTKPKSKSSTPSSPAVATNASVPTDGAGSVAPSHPTPVPSTTPPHSTASDDEDEPVVIAPPHKLHLGVLLTDSSPTSSPPLTGESSPKLTIVSLKPNPALNQLENTPVSPRAAEFLRERSNSVSVTPTGAGPTKKKEKAMDLLGLGTESRAAASMTQMVRELGVANSKLQKELEIENAKREQLEKDIVRLRELHEAKTAKISEFHAKLTSSVLYRRNKNAHIRRLTMHCKRTLNPSIDDNLWDYQSATQYDRRAVLASTIFSRVQAATPPSHSRSQSSRLSSKNRASKPANHRTATAPEDTDHSHSSNPATPVLASSLDASGSSTIMSVLNGGP